MSNNLLEELKYKIAQYEEQVKALTQSVNQKNMELNNIALKMSELRSRVEMKKTDEYYRAWAKMENTLLAEGEYVELFKSSDALIHDCGSFMAEYLVTNKPVLFLEKNNYKMPLNEFGKLCLNQHYIARKKQTIITFLDDVVLGSNDPMKEQRLAFVNNELKMNSSELVADRIFKEIKMDLL